MQRVIFCGMAIGAVFGAATICNAQAHEMPKASKQHELLKQFVGEWDATAETVPAPGQEAIKCEGSESAKMVGDFWYVGDAQSNMLGMPVKSLITIGFDPKTEKYVGTFVCSVDSTHWKYEGAMDEAGKKLTLYAEGPSVTDPSKTAKYRETLELKDKDHKVFESFIQTNDGDWMKIVTVDYRRKK